MRVSTAKTMTLGCIGVLLFVIQGVSPVTAAVRPRKKQGSSFPTIFQRASTQERLKALRVAQIDAMRLLAERVYGFRLSSGSTVQDFVLCSDNIRAALETTLLGATETEDPEYTEDGIVYVVMGLNLRDVVEVITKEVKETDDGHLKSICEKRIENVDTFIDVTGNGALPDSDGMKMIRAKRAAEMDAFRKMAERIKGVKVNSRTTVREMCLESDQILTSTCAFLKGIKPIDIVYNADKSCEVTVQLKIREVIETVERIVKTHKKGFFTRKEEMEKVNRDIVDRVFTETGHGSPGKALTGSSGSQAEAVDNNSVFREEKTILRRVIASGVVVE